MNNSLNFDQSFVGWSAKGNNSAIPECNSNSNSNNTAATGIVPLDTFRSFNECNNNFAPQSTAVRKRKHRDTDYEACQGEHNYFTPKTRQYPPQHDVGRSWGAPAQGSIARKSSNDTKMQHGGESVKHKKMGLVSWEARFLELVQFVARNGHAKVPADPQQGIFSLANWVFEQRQQYQMMTKGLESRLTPHQVELLSSIGFVLDESKQDSAQSLSPEIAMEVAKGILVGCQGVLEQASQSHNNQVQQKPMSNNNAHNAGCISSLQTASPRNVKVEDIKKLAPTPTNTTKNTLMFPRNIPASRQQAPNLDFGLVGTAASGEANTGDFEPLHFPSKCNNSLNSKLEGMKPTGYCTPFSTDSNCSAQSQPNSCNMPPLESLPLESTFQPISDRLLVSNTPANPSRERGNGAYLQINSYTSKGLQLEAQQRELVQAAFGQQQPVTVVDLSQIQQLPKNNSLPTSGGLIPILDQALQTSSESDSSTGGLSTTSSSLLQHMPQSQQLMDLSLARLSQNFNNAASSQPTPSSVQNNNNQHRKSNFAKREEEFQEEIVKVLGFNWI